MLGEFATSKAGHDKDRLYMIVGEEEEWVYLCDGRLRGVEHPKKKKKKHIQIIHSSAEDALIQSMQHCMTGAVCGCARAHHRGLAVIHGVTAKWTLVNFATICTVKRHAKVL